MNRKHRGIKGTDVYLAIMLGFWIWYIWFQAQTFEQTGSWLPELLTIGTIILLFYEVFSLLRVHLVKEGIDDRGIIAGTYNKVKSWANGKVPIELPDTEIDVQIAKEQKETTDAQTDKP